MFRQYTLRHTSHPGSGTFMERLCWLDRTDLKVGQKVDLKKDPMAVTWTVHEVHTETTDEPQWRTWKVGGLS